MRDTLMQAFGEAFGRDPAVIVRAPGRVNLIGEHTDYNDGLVFPCAIDYQTLVAIAPREDGQVHSLALDWDNQRDSFALEADIARHPDQLWSDYVRGVIGEMKSNGYLLRGCDIAITGNVPQGAGLSSSAALEVGVARAVAEVSDLSLEPLQLARIGQAAENHFVGCACGIMDQLISAAGVEGQALAIDCRDLSWTPVPVPESLTVLMINSNVRRGLVDSEYNVRREQCEAAARHFGAATLRDVNLQQLDADDGALDPVAARRARHVLEENQRVIDAVEALRAGDIARLSSLMADSHRSMRDLFEITTPEIDLLVNIVSSVVGERGGVRMTGGGFGGCIVALLDSSLVGPVMARVDQVYEAATGLRATAYTGRPAQGASLLLHAAN
jgi:galactokinase